MLPARHRLQTLLPGASLLAVAVAGGLLAGCGPPAAERATVAFQAAEKAPGPVVIEGIPLQGSIQRNTGQPTEFTLREESSAREMRVVAEPEVSVPANITSASYVTVTGSYDPARRRFNATRVETRVPNRDQQPRG